MSKTKQLKLQGGPMFLQCHLLNSFILFAQRFIHFCGFFNPANLQNDKMQTDDGKKGENSM